MLTNANQPIMPAAGLASTDIAMTLLRTNCTNSSNRSGASVAALPPAAGASPFVVAAGSAVAAAAARGNANNPNTDENDAEAGNSPSVMCHVYSFADAAPETYFYKGAGVRKSGGVDDVDSSSARSLDAGGASDYAHAKAKDLTAATSTSAVVAVPTRAVNPSALAAIPTPTIAPDTSRYSSVASVSSASNNTNNTNNTNNRSLSQLAYGRHIQLTCIDQLTSQFATSPLAAELARDPAAILKSVMVVHIKGIAQPIYAACTYDGVMFVHLIQDPAAAASGATGLHGSSNAFRKAVVAILELAEDSLECTQLIASMHPQDKSLALALRYVGFELVSPQVVAHETSKCVLLAYTM